jgi:hypothetical protein
VRGSPARESTRRSAEGRRTTAEVPRTTAPPFSLRYVWFETKMCSCWQILHINPGAKAAEFPLSSRVQVCAPGNKILIFAGTSFRFSYLRRYKFTASRPRSPPLLLIDSAAHHSATRVAEFSETRIVGICVLLILDPPVATATSEMPQPQKELAIYP